MAEIPFKSDIAGHIISISPAQGDKVQQGDEVAVIESMKMEIPLTAEVGGIVRAVLVKVDDVIHEGQALLILDT